MGGDGLCMCGCWGRGARLRPHGRRGPVPHTLPDVDDGPSQTGRVLHVPPVPHRYCTYCSMYCLYRRDWINERMTAAIGETLPDALPDFVPKPLGDGGAGAGAGRTTSPCACTPDGR